MQNSEGRDPDEPSEPSSRPSLRAKAPPKPKTRPRPSRAPRADAVDARKAAGASEEPGDEERKSAAPFSLTRSKDKAPDEQPSDDGPASGPPSSEAPPSEPEGSELVGKTLAGRYQVEAILGLGTMGVVYRCRHLVIDRAVAIKILRAELAQEQEVLQRFTTEAKAASSIGNSHIVEVLDFGRLADGSFYLVMEHLEGQTLGQLLEASPLLPAPVVLSIGRQIAEALAAAHQAGVVHRDLKPDNIFLSEVESGDYFVKILDFGIAKFAASQNKLTQQGALFGTPHYMSPEQAAAESADHRSDIYSLGVILFELACGVVPFDGENPVTVLAQHVHDPAPKPSSMLPEGRTLPPGIEPVIVKCLAKDPDKRYQDMAAIAQDLLSVSSGIEPEVVIEEVPWTEESTARTRRDTPPAKSGRTVLYLAAGAALLAGGALTARSLSERSMHATQAEPSPTPSVAIEPERESDPAAKQPEGTKVDLILFPLDAHVFKGEKDLGPMPVSVFVEEGKKQHLTIQRAGYWTRKLVLDGSRNRIVIGLRKYNQPAYKDDIAPAEAKEEPESAEAEPADTTEGESEKAEASAEDPKKAAADEPGESEGAQPTPSKPPETTAVAPPAKPPTVKPD